MPDEPDLGVCDGCGDTVPVDLLTEIQGGIWPLNYCEVCMEAIADMPRP